MSKQLRVSENQRFLVYEDQTPFFYLGDTAWELFHRLDRTEADYYLRDRAAKGFTVIQAVVLAEYDGLSAPNPYGHLPLHDNDPTRPNESYFQHVDWIIDRAEALGLYIGLLPTWGDKWNKKWGVGPEIFTPENAALYGQFLGERYKDKPILWILGGDRPIESEAHKEIIRATARGVRAGDNGTHLITLHPSGWQSSAQNFHGEEWLDFNMWQSGHGRNGTNYSLVAQTYALTPTKPCLDGEPAYEDHPADFKIDNGYIEEWDCRKSLYWALFAGAFGHTYGCHAIWQFWSTRHEVISHVRREWHEALRLPGSNQMQHGKYLLLSRPFLSRIPASDMIVGEPGTGAQHLEATRDEFGTYAFIYFPCNRSATIDLSKLSGKNLTAWWFDPRTGTAERIAESLTLTDGPHVFHTPRGGPDWVLVLDDASQNYAAPGAVR